MGRRWRMVHGHTHSRSAEDAEGRGEMPLGRAVEAVYVGLECKSHGVSRRSVRASLERECGAGWHHVAGPGGVRQVPYFTTVLNDDQRAGLLSRGRRGKS